jgi:predicted phage terminase large subunit-like protein
MPCAYWLRRLEGNLIKRDWIRYFKGSPPRREGDYFVISWDTAMKASELADYSVATVWQIQDRGDKINLVDVVRGRFEYPELVAAASALWHKWKLAGTYSYLVIEDKGSGSSLIQSLKKERIYAHQHHDKLEGDKVMRLTAQAAHFHADVVHFREDAPWLDELMAELLGFPDVRHDDEVDSISQAVPTANPRWLTAAANQPILAPNERSLQVDLVCPDRNVPVAGFVGSRGPCPSTPTQRAAAQIPQAIGLRRGSTLLLVHIQLP